MAISTSGSSRASRSRRAEQLVIVLCNMYCKLANVSPYTDQCSVSLRGLLATLDTWVIGSPNHLGRTS